MTPNTTPNLETKAKNIMTDGLGISGFLSGDGEGKRTGFGGGGQWLPAWHKDKKSIIVWPHFTAKPAIFYNHTIPVLGEKDEYVDDRKTGNKITLLQFPRFVSPDHPDIHANQFKRDRDSGMMVDAPVYDQFLLAREFIRSLIQKKVITPDTVVFAWDDPKNRRRIEWRAGELTGIVKRGQTNWNHSIDSNYQCIFTVVDNSNIEGGAKLTREGRAMTEAVRALIVNEIKGKGDERGNPQKTPYAMRWEYDASAQGADKYTAFRYERDDAPYTEAVRDAICDPEMQFAVEPHTKPDPNDATKIHGAFMAAAQIELPLDIICSGDRDAYRQLMNLHTGNAVSSSAPAVAPAAAPRTAPAAAAPRSAPPVQGGAPAPAATAPAPAAAPATTGRRLASPPVEMVPCEVCNHSMPITLAVCPKCGAKYDVEPETTPAAAAPAQAAPAAAAPVTQAAAPVAAAPGGSAPCWACGSTDVGTNDAGAVVCFECGVEQAALMDT